MAGSDSKYSIYCYKITEIIFVTGVWLLEVFQNYTVPDKDVQM